MHILRLLLGGVERIRPERAGDQIADEVCKILQLPDLLLIGFLGGFGFRRLRLWLVFLFLR